MQLVSGKAKRIRRFILLLSILLLSPLAEARADSSVRAAFFPLRAVTWIDGFESGSHTGYAIGFDYRWSSENRKRSIQTSFPVIQRLWSAGFSLQYADIQASSWLADGSRYRAWNALSMGPFMGIGFACKALLKRPVHRTMISAGPSVSFSNSTGTSLYSAYWGAWARLTWEIDMQEHISLTMELPIEYCARADGTSVLAGFGIGVRYVF